MPRDIHPPILGFPPSGCLQQPRPAETMQHRCNGRCIFGLFFNADASGTPVLKLKTRECNAM
jgi:hypothetical protein